ncbi:hypothetical protein K438DRAFT_826718, partial [Mycena galopus ATCC 62051]
EIEENSGRDQDGQELVLRNILGACYAGADTTVSSPDTNKTFFFDAVTEPNNYSEMLQ